MKIKITLLSSFLVLFCIGTAFAQSLGSIENSTAYNRYQSRAKTKLSELIYLMDRFNVPGVEVNLDGNIFPAEKAFPYLKINLNVSYEQETAEDWINRYCYRSDETNKVIYMRVNDGGFKPMRDIFLKELQNLRDLKR